jgi:hypothetical protein
MGRNSIVFGSKKKETRMVRIRRKDELALSARRTTRPHCVVSIVTPATSPSVLQVTSRQEIVSNNMLKIFVARATKRSVLELTMAFPAAIEHSFVAST